MFLNTHKKINPTKSAKPQKPVNNNCYVKNRLKKKKSFPKREERICKMFLL